MPTTIKDIARLAGVSVSTVSRALTDSEHAVNQETRQSILRIARELGYKPNRLARALRSDRTYTVGVILDTFTSPFSPLSLQGIQDTLKPAGFSTIVTSSDWESKIEAESVDDLVSRPVDGVIFVDTWLHSSNELPPPSSKPYIFINRLFQASEYNGIGPDDHGGARLATEHLIRTGHRRIALINGPHGWVASVNRLAGYKDALSANQIPFDQQLVLWGTWEVIDGYHCTQELLKSPSPPTAIFAANDFMAVGAVYALQDKGLRVPEDIAVVGYDDRQIASLIRPALTTVTMPCYEMGQAAAEVFLNTIERPNMANTTRLVSGKLVVRQSCGSSERFSDGKEFWGKTTPKRLLEFPADQE